METAARRATEGKPFPDLPQDKNLYPSADVIGCNVAVLIRVAVKEYRHCQKLNNLTSA